MLLLLEKEEGKRKKEKKRKKGNAYYYSGLAATFFASSAVQTKIISKASSFSLSLVSVSFVSSCFRAEKEGTIPRNWNTKVRQQPNEDEDEEASLK